MQDRFKWTLIMSVGRKYALPALFGAAVAWLVAHNLGPWADVLCAVSDALLIDVPECK
jgi:hypothetical protein